MDLNIFWFVMLGVLLAGYSILDGFDLGVGTLHFFVKGDHEKRVLLNSIGPLWDGNEVWLVTFGGALFAAFPHAYATAFSAFYLPFMLLLVFLIGRAVSIEFRSKIAHPWWHAYWDFSFAAASTLAVFVSGVAVGNAIQGIPIGADFEYQGTLLQLFRPYPLLVGLFAVATATLHGSIFLFLKTEGELHDKLQHWMWRAFGFFLILYVLVTIFTLVRVPHAVRNFEEMPVAWLIVVLNVLAVANIPRAIYQGKPGYAFGSSCATIAALVFLFGMALFPNIILNSLDNASSLDIYEAASSQRTLGIMRIVAAIGMPFVFAYTGVVYWVFRGKTKLDEFSY